MPTGPFPFPAVAKGVIMSDQSTSSPPGVWTEASIRALGVTTDVPTAGRILGLTRHHAYDLAKRRQFPFPLLRVGARIRVPVAGILTALGYPP
jgi:hypothetical protein